MISKLTEKELAECVVKHFAKLPGWTLHHEVAACGCVADFVATDGRIVHVIEVKKSQSLALLDQMLGWCGHAHLVSGAVPYSRRANRNARAFRWAAKQMGAGLFELQPSSDDRPCTEVVPPTLLRKTSGLIMKALCEEQTRPDEWAHAGSAQGGHFTPFRSTCNNMLRYVQKNPGCTMKEIVDNIKHHYASDASAKSSLARWISEGTIKGIKLIKGEGYVRDQ